MKKLPLTQGMFALIDDEDLTRVRGLKWHAYIDTHHEGRWKARGFLNSNRGKRKSIRVLLSRFIMKAPADMVVDHINHDTLDNRKKNLRLCSRFQNAKNKLTYKNNTSGFKGVSEKTKGVFAAYICMDKVQIFLGYYKTAEDAAKRYNRAASKLHKEFAALNKIPRAE